MSKSCDIVVTWDTLRIKIEFWLKQQWKSNKNGEKIFLLSWVGQLACNYQAMQMYLIISGLMVRIGNYFTDNTVVKTQLGIILKTLIKHI